MATVEWDHVAPKPVISVCHSDGWIELRYEGRMIYSGHPMPKWEDLKYLLENLGFTVKKETT